MPTEEQAAMVVVSNALEELERVRGILEHALEVLQSLHAKSPEVRPALSVAAGGDS